MKMDLKDIKTNIEVEIGYTTYLFDNVDDADCFCRLAAISLDDEYSRKISMNIHYIKKEGESDE